MCDQSTRAAKHAARRVWQCVNFASPNLLKELCKLGWYNEVSAHLFKLTVWFNCISKTSILLFV